ncbi:MAG: hypothetical protein JSW69_04605 [Deltaproteobacteria bacterium]|nr:MAG: hypothetical protein JSW69_04605 [Deltaproteobacteria bacterium]
MPIEYEIIEDQQLVLAKGSGVITGGDVVGHLDSLAADGKYKAPMKKLVDYRYIDDIRISSEEAVTIALKKDTFSKKFYGEKCAFVTPGERTYNTSRAHQALVNSTDIDTAVFREIKEALDWLDVTLD